MNKTMQRTSKKTIWIVIAVLAVLAAAFAIIYTQFGPKTTEGSKKITVEVVLEDKTVQTYHYATDAMYLGEVLEKEKLIEGTKGEFGLFVTKVAGVEVDANKQQWWCFTKNGDNVMTGVDQTPIADGEKYEITFTTGY